MFRRVSAVAHEEGTNAGFAFVMMTAGGGLSQWPLHPAAALRFARKPGRKWQGGRKHARQGPALGRWCPDTLTPGSRARRASAASDCSLELDQCRWLSGDKSFVQTISIL